MNEDQACTVLDGAYKRTGKINIVSAGKKEGITPVSYTHLFLK